MGGPFYLHLSSAQYSHINPSSICLSVCEKGSIQFGSYVPGNVPQGSGASLFAIWQGVRTEQANWRVTEYWPSFMDAEWNGTWLNGNRGKLHVNTTCNVNTLTAAARFVNQQCDIDRRRHPLTLIDVVLGLHTAAFRILQSQFVAPVAASLRGRQLIKDNSMRGMGAINCASNEIISGSWPARTMARVSILPNLYLLLLSDSSRAAASWAALLHRFEFRNIKQSKRARAASIKRFGLTRRTKC